MDNEVQKKIEFLKMQCEAHLKDYKKYQEQLQETAIFLSGTQYLSQRQASLDKIIALSYNAKEALKRYENTYKTINELETNNL